MIHFGFFVQCSSCWEWFYRALFQNRSNVLLQCFPTKCKTAKIGFCSWNSLNLGTSRWSLVSQQKYQFGSSSISTLAFLICSSGVFLPWILKIRVYGGRKHRTKKYRTVADRVFPLECMHLWCAWTIEGYHSSVGTPALNSSDSLGDQSQFEKGLDGSGPL